MNTMKVSKLTLRGILTTNREEHRNLFLAAQKVYRDLVIKELDTMLQDARTGSNIRRHVNLKTPEDHTKDYDKLIGLMDLSTDESVELTLMEYDQYVNDNWAWAVRSKTLNTNYVSNNTSPMFVGEDASLGSSY